jgi:hypothetical protein
MAKDALWVKRTLPGIAGIGRASLRENERILHVVTEQIARGESINFLSCKWLCYL